MLFVKNLLKKLGYNLQPEKLAKVYSSIDDLPQWNWEQVHKTGNFAYIKQLKNYRKIEVDKSPTLEQLWEDIYNEYLEEFGLSKQYLDLLERKKKLARLKNEFILTDDRSLLNFIKIEQMELDAAFSKGEGMSFESVVIGIEKIQKINIKTKEITVYEYNNYLRTLTQQKDE